VAKRTRKVYSTQRDKSVIETAKYLKRVGALSPKANLHSGKYVSRNVLKKVRELRFVESANYTTIKVSKAVAQRDKELGYTVLRGNRVVAPKQDRRYREALKRGEPAGVIPLRQGVMEVVPLPHDAFSIRQMLEHPEEFDRLKNPNEVFGTRFFGNMGYNTFPNTETARREWDKYLVKLAAWERSRKFRDDAEEVEAFVVVRMRPEDTRAFIANREERERARRGEKVRRSGKSRRKVVPRAEMLKAKQTRLREYDRERKRLARQNMSDAERARQSELSKIRMRRFRDSLKEE
jgi:hypothetical protein